MKKLSSISQDYLEAILLLSQENDQYINLSDICRYMEVGKGWAKKELRILYRNGLIRWDNSRQLMLTEKGKFIARRIHFLHHLVKAFFMESLGIQEEVAEAEACQIEHLIGNETARAMVNYLKKRNVELDHFNLDSADDFLVYTKRLSELKVGDRAVIKRIEACGNLKKRIMEMGVIRDDIVEIKGIAPMGDPIEIKIGDYTLSLRLEEADLVSVEII